MTQTFQPMSAEQQRQFRASYLSHLRARDGVPDLATQKFDVRERFFAEIDANPTVWVGPPPISQAVFDRNFTRATPEAGLDEVTLWALATAKTNRAERYGVQHELDVHGVPANAADDPHVYIQVEEFYHTRILEDALAAVGVRMTVQRPGFVTRMLVRGMVQLPDVVSDVAVLCGEIVGVALFSLLLERARTLFAAQPAALARIEALFGQILVDEVGHVHYVRSKLSPLQLAAAKQMLPLVAHSALRDLPELVALFGRQNIVRRAVEADVDAAAAPYPDRFVWA